jgi:hypothetical protein
MSWLYSIIFAGLAISGGEVSFDPAIISQPESRSIDVQRQAKDVTEKIEQSYALTPNGRVSLSNVNGTVVLEAWDRSEVRLEAVKVASSEEMLKDVEVIVEARADSIRIRSEYFNQRAGARGVWNKDRKLEVNYKLFVPRNARLDEIATVNGLVSIANFSGFVKASAVNGNVNATNLSGDVSLSTVNGEVNADFERVDAGSRIALSTVNGRVRLVVPSDLNATVRAETLNGTITNEFGLTVRQGQFIGRDLNGRIGTGDVPIKLDSVNGGLSISRRKDGRNPNPVENLHGANAATTTSTGSTARARAQAARGGVDISKEIAEGLKEAQKEMEKIGPELEKMKIDVDLKGIEIKTMANAATRTAVLGRLIDAANRATPPSMHRNVKSFDVKERPRVKVGSVGCNISIKSWDKNEVRYTLVEAGSLAGSGIVSVKDSALENVVEITAENDAPPRRSGMPGGFSARLDIMVPRNADLDIKSDSDLRIEGVSGKIAVTGEDQRIDLRDLAGELKLVAEDAQIRLVGHKGDLDSTIAKGSAFFEGDFRAITSRAGEGKVVITLPETASARLISNSKVKADGIKVVENNDGTYQIGSGGPTFRFQFDGGDLTLRGRGVITAG